MAPLLSPRGSFSLSEAWVPSLLSSLNLLASLLPSLGAKLKKCLEATLVNLVNVNQCLRTFALSSAQNHPLDLTTSPSCFFLSFQSSFSPTLFFPGEVALQVHLLYVSSSWH